MEAIRTIQSLERLRNSANGNPRFRIMFTDGSAAVTEPDAALGYVIENPEYRDVPLAVTFNRHGRVSRARPA